VIVDDLYRFWSAIGPHEADAILVIDPYAMLARSAASQTLEPVSRWYAEFVQVDDGIELVQLPQCSPLQLLRQDCSGVLRSSPVEYIFGTTITERSDHDSMITRLLGYFNHATGAA